ncbi:unnamed protein product [Cylindrotheca closterium]|uniref:Uncharacterized protein n=1 Tax=Cylindrotheca closterium TaxID=2856 RepID=A0AAD2JLM7_9STRA|nr:unnamed protein product [Cylindrotheca closterium]
MVIHSSFTIEHGRVHNIIKLDNQMYMKKVNSAIPYMSEALDPLDEEEFKRVFFNAHPKPWKDAFLEINGTLDNHSVASITSYMQRKAR